MAQQGRKTGASIRVGDFLREAQGRQPDIGKRTVSRPRQVRAAGTRSALFGTLRTLLRAANYGPLGKVVQFGLAILLYFGLMHLDLSTGLSTRLFGMEQSGGVVTLSAPKGDTLSNPD